MNRKILAIGATSVLLAFGGLVLLALVVMGCPDCGGEGGWPHPCETCGEPHHLRPVSPRPIR